MNTWKIPYWAFTLLLGLINPLFSVTLVVLYYLPKIIQDICNPKETVEHSRMKSYSDDVAEEMK